MDLQRKAAETKMRAEMDMQQEAAKLDFQYDKLSEQAAQSDERLEVAREKIAKK